MGFLDSLFGKKKNEKPQTAHSSKPMAAAKSSMPQRPNEIPRSASLQKWTKPVSVQTVYKKSVSFHVERFEEWQGGRCINKGPLNFDLHLIASNDRISLNVPENDRFRTHHHASFPFLGSQMMEDRVQYVDAPGTSTDSTKPIVLHIFVKNNKIDYIRLAMSFPDRIVEFYGYQVVSSASNPKDFDDTLSATSQSDAYKLTFLSSLVNVAACDGEIADVEMQTLMAFLQREGMKQSDLMRVITNPTSIPHIIPQSPAIRAQHIRDVVTLAMVDGRFHPKEYELCKQIAIGLGFRPEVVDVIRQELNNQIGSNI